MRQREDGAVSVRYVRQLIMVTIPVGPPPLFNWFSLPYKDYAKARKEEAAFHRRWWANYHREQAFSRAQQGGN